MNLPPVKPINDETDYVVFYRTGGTKQCSWVLVLERYPDFNQAARKVRLLDAQGYFAILCPYETWLEKKLPIGWNEDSSDIHPEDKVEITHYRTNWTSHEILAEKLEA